MKTRYQLATAPMPVRPHIDNFTNESEFNRAAAGYHGRLRLLGDRLIWALDEFRDRRKVARLGREATNREGAYVQKLRKVNRELQRLREEEAERASAEGK